MYLAGQSKSAMTLGLMQPLASAIEMGLNLIEPTTQKDHHLGVLDLLDLRPVPGTYRLDGPGWPELQQHLLQNKSWWIQGWNSWNSSHFDPVSGRCLHSYTNQEQSTANLYDASNLQACPFSWHWFWMLNPLLYPSHLANRLCSWWTKWDQ